MSVVDEPDVEELLRPISPDLPVGTDPRLDPSFTSDWRTLRDARDDARRAEREAVNDGRSPFESKPVWKNTCELAKRILSSEAKDVEAACYLVESWVRLEGFDGLGRGLVTLSGLVKEYGAALFPEPPEGAEPADACSPSSGCADPWLRRWSCCRSPMPASTARSRPGNCGKPRRSKGLVDRLQFRWKRFAGPRKTRRPKRSRRWPTNSISRTRLSPSWTRP